MEIHLVMLLERDGVFELGRGGGDISMLEKKTNCRRCPWLSERFISTWL